MSPYESIEVGASWTTGGRTITEADVVNFSGTTGDFNPLHLDAEYAAESAYGERIAQGALVFSTLIGLVWQSRSERERDAVVAFYGVDELRFVAPVYVEDTLRAEVEVLDKHERDHPVATGVVRYGATATAARADGDRETVLACELLSLVE